MKFAIYGCEGFAREVFPVLRESFENKRGSNQKLDVVFVDDDPQWHGKIVNGIRVLSFADLCGESDRKRLITIAIANPMIRRNLADKCQKEGFQFADVMSSKSSIYDECEIGDGVILCENTIVTSNAKIGKHFHCNIYSYVAHDCIIGDYVTFAPKVCCNGSIHVEDFACIGTGALLRQGARGKPLIVGEGANIGIGAVVTKDVAPGTTVVGNPARILTKS